MKVDADTGEEVSNDDIMKGYKVDTDTYIEVSKDELENIALESTRTIDIDEFVPKSDIDPRYLIRPYYLVPDGKVGHDAYRSRDDDVDVIAAFPPHLVLFGGLDRNPSLTPRSEG
jgi:non-homologous end joining protein Ku